jgi:hypothetical protein
MASTFRTDTWLVRTWAGFKPLVELEADEIYAVLYHQPEKMLRSKEDLAERQENLERLKQQHGIE